VIGVFHGFDSFLGKAPDAPNAFLNADPADQADKWDLKNQLDPS
jgi:hypothetical protein